MPRGERFERLGPQPVGYMAKQKMSDEDLAKANETRAPLDQLVKVETCGARKMGRPRDGNPDNLCMHPAGFGTAHVGFGRCKFHGGNTKNGAKGAAIAWGRQILMEAKFGGAKEDIPDVTAEEALLEEVRRSVAMVRWLEDRIGTFDLSEADTPAGLGGLPALISETSRGAASSTDVAAWLLLYREERSHMIRTAKTAIDAGIAERMVKIAEEQGRTLAGAIRRILAALNLTPDQAALVPQVVPSILRELSAGPVMIESTVEQ